MKKNLTKNYFTNIGTILITVMAVAACTDQGASVPLTASDYPESNTEPAKLYIAKCGECHAAPLPKIHTVKQWPGVVQRMQFRMTSKAMRELNKHEFNMIVEYLQKHARDSK